MPRAIPVFLAVLIATLSACDEAVIVSPHHPVVVGGPHHDCVEIRDPALRARVVTRLEPRFRGPRRGGARITLREHLRTHRYRVLDCGDVWRVMFFSNDLRIATSYVILRKDGVVLNQPY